MAPPVPPIDNTFIAAPFLAGQRHRRRLGVAMGAMLGLAVVGGCSDHDADQPGSQSEEQVLDGYRTHRSDITVSATVAVSSETTRLVRVHIENTGLGGSVDDVRVHLVVDGSASVVEPLPDTCSTVGSIECRVGWLGSPPASDSTQDQPSFVDLEFTFDVGDDPGAVRSRVTVTVDSSIHGEIEERRVDETPDDNIATVEV